MKLESLALHHGYEAEATTKAAAVPIYQTTSYTFDDTQHGADLFDLKVAGNIYTRIMNPTTAVLESRLAEMEGGIGALAVASGMAAITYAIQAITGAGDNIVSTSQLYGGTYNLFAHSLPRQGVDVRMASFDDYEGIERFIDDKTRAVFCESIGNPAGNIVDIEKLADIAHSYGVPLIVDNTVATPYLCKAFEHGADIIVHSLTKYIGGHGTTIGGIIIDSGKFDWLANKDRFPMLNEPDPAYHGVVYTEALGDAAYIGRCRVVPLRNTGAALAPHSAFLLLQGLETLGLRMERHCENAMKVAQHLQNHPKVEWVSYAALADSAYNPVCRKITSGQGHSLAAKRSTALGSLFGSGLWMFKPAIPAMMPINGGKSPPPNNSSNTDDRIKTSPPCFRWTNASDQIRMNRPIINFMNRKPRKQYSAPIKKVRIWNW